MPDGPPHLSEFSEHGADCLSMDIYNSFFFFALQLLGLCPILTWVYFCSTAAIITSRSDGIICYHLCICQHDHIILYSVCS
ncbi:hypothetical protein XELAEV_18044535mg [Xenopus laevis]|uniref:Uncharacterized protein n=1 Tax=Xenopus laevis TaxID=8355 RepID=A0A974H3C0_XENLA|nr:hypothetical protein XELAEV_18044535mg [Xenopus laevis]